MNSTYHFFDIIYQVRQPVLVSSLRVITFSIAPTKKAMNNILNLMIIWGSKFTVNKNMQNLLSQRLQSLVPLII